MGTAKSEPVHFYNPALWGAETGRLLVFVGNQPISRLLVEGPKRTKIEIGEVGLLMSFSGLCLSLYTYEYTLQVHHNTEIENILLLL